jgi:hypothetical protein
MSGGGFEGKSNDIVYSDNAEYNYGSLSIKGAFLLLCQSLFT